MTGLLHELIEESVVRRGRHPAVEDPVRDTVVSYRELGDLSTEIAGALASIGVREGDRVGLCASKAIGSVASILGILKAGGAYVPVDPTAPMRRAAGIFEDCGVRAVIAEQSLADGLADALGGKRRGKTVELSSTGTHGPPLVLMEGTQPGPPVDGQRLAYILYTSGSTGKPKGVVHTHASAKSFVDWCSGAFDPRESDRFSSHAPFHFDLSILDLYVSLKHGATLVLFGEELGKTPQHIAATIAHRRISVWYSTPSVLRYLVEFGDLDQYDWSALRVVHFAGEVFPMKYFHLLRSAWPGPRYFNLYGPTETNVCTYYEAPPRVPAERTTPFPIGRVCENDQAKVVDEHGVEVAPGEEGELLIAGGTVMQGYWNLPERTESVFSTDAAGIRWYRTGDIVWEDTDQEFIFVGRRDRMVKKRGYRVELGEIEAALSTHSDVVEAAVVAKTSGDGDVAIRGYLSCSADASPSLIELKRWCAERVPLYMVPDRITVLPALPKTSTDKVDYQTLGNMD